jgi:putative ABC transport system permease protein
MNLAAFAVKNLRRRPMRTSLSILGVGLAVGAVLALVALSDSITESTRERFDEYGGDLTVMQRGAPDFFGGFLPETLESQIAAIPGVVRVAGELLMFVPAEDDKHVLVTGWKEGSSSWSDVPIREGRLPVAGERGVALLGDNVAETMGKSLGDQMELLGVRFRIIGITKYTSVINRSLVILPLADVQAATYRTGQVTIFQVSVARAAPAAEIERIRSDINRLGKLLVSTSSEVLQSDRNVKGFQAVSVAITAIALAMGIMNVLNTLLMTIQEHTREIGIMTAIGWSDRLIMSSIVIEGLLMCAAGCAIGIVLGYLASFFFYLIPISGSYLSFRPSVGLILPTIAGTVVLCTIGSLYPAWRAVRMPPAEALRRT